MQKKPRSKPCIDALVAFKLAERLRGQHRYYKEATVALCVAFSRAQEPHWCTVAPVLAIPAHTKAKNARLLRS